MLQNCVDTESCPRTHSARQNEVGMDPLVDRWRGTQRTGSATAAEARERSISAGCLKALGPPSPATPLFPPVCGAERAEEVWSEAMARSDRERRDPEA